MEGSEKPLKLQVDFGSEIGPKTIFSGIKKWYTTDSIKDRKFIFVVNLAQKEFKFGISEAVLYSFDKNVTNGSTIK